MNRASHQVTQELERTLKKKQIPWRHGYVAWSALGDGYTAGRFHKHGEFCLFDVDKISVPATVHFLEGEKSVLE